MCHWIAWYLFNFFFHINCKPENLVVFVHFIGFIISLLLIAINKKKFLKNWRQKPTHSKLNIGNIVSGQKQRHWYRCCRRYCHRHCFLKKMTKKMKKKHSFYANSVAVLSSVWLDFFTTWFLFPFAFQRRASFFQFARTPFACAILKAKIYCVYYAFYESPYLNIKNVYWA